MASKHIKANYKIFPPFSRLRKAMGGISTDEKMVIEIFVTHTYDQVGFAVLSVQKDKLTGKH
jgi:hypothetical protein